MSESNPHGIKPGQRLWYVPRQRYIDEHEVEVESVGRKWAKIGGWKKACLASLVVFEGNGRLEYAVGECYLTLEAYRAVVEIRKAYQQLLSRMSLVTPADIDLNDIRAAALALKITLDDMPKEGK